MTCPSCENRVEKAVKEIQGVTAVRASYSGQFVEVEYEDKLCNLNEIKVAIKNAGYTIETSKDHKFMGILIIVATVVLLGLNTSGFDMEAKLTNASYAVLFVVGILTSIHCVGMCGGIMLSQSLSKESNSKFEAIKPFIVGLLNGLMPCGPLQTMQLFALGTGSALKGAASMFVFAMGTVPLMLTFGAISGILSKGYTKKIFKFSGVLIIALGFIMGNRGFALFGININPVTALASTARALIGGNSSGVGGDNVAKAVIQDGVQVINMTANNNGYTPNAFYVQKGIPVKWIIKATELNSCNNAIVIPDLDREIKIKRGENVIEFTPDEAKDINFSCWMGMIRGVVKVVDNLDSVDTSKADPSLPPASTSPSCCATPIDDGTEYPPSIYGEDITKAPTAALVGKAVVLEGYQSAKFKGIGYELQPLIVVTGNSIKTKLTFDLSAFDNVEGEYLIIDGTTGDEVASFTGVTGINEVEFSPSKSGDYAIIKDDFILGIIEVVDNLETTDIQQVRDKYIK